MKKRISTRDRKLQEAGKISKVDRYQEERPARVQAQPHPRDPVHLQGEGAPGQHQVRQDRGPPQEGRHYRHGHPSGRLILFSFLFL